MPQSMDFTDLRVMAARTAGGELFSAVWTVRGMIIATSEGEVRTGPNLDRDRNAIIERLGACSLQSEAELRQKLIRLGLTNDAMTQKFDSARAWMTTIVISDRPGQFK
jgi:hypothetical protein